MKITILCAIVMLSLGVAHLQSVELGKNSEEGFRFRHGPMVKYSVPITNIQQVSAPVGYEIGVDLKDEPAGPDSLAYNDNSGSSSTTSVQLTPGSDKNRIYMEYGTNFWFSGEVKNNLDQVTVVTLIPISRFRDVKRTPLKFSNCTPDVNQNGAEVDGHLQQYAHEWCAKVMPFIHLMQAQEKDLLRSLRTLLVDELYAVIPELN